MNNPFDYIPDAECENAFLKLLSRLDAIRESEKPEDIGFYRELEAGKMLGVLVAEDKSGVRHILYAFSGQSGEIGFNYPGFVGPVFDYLEPDGYFKRHEADISRQNKEIAKYEGKAVVKARCGYEEAKERLNDAISEYRERYRLSKLGRDSRRASGHADEKELADMIRQSQFEKAELRRLKKRLNAELAPLETNLKKVQAHLNAMIEKRRCDSETLQKWLFDNFRLLNARGESRSLSEIFSETPMKIPPSGAGECCAPKLLQAAYLQGLKPQAIAEYWYGKPKGGELRVHGRHYPACRGKCLPVLRWMLQGLEIDSPPDKINSPEDIPEPEIIYENQWFCIVNKPAGMLSVPGKGRLKSVQEWLEDKYGKRIDVRAAHRLDQDTSGLILVSFGRESLKVMQSLFATRKVKKTYIAELEGDYKLLGKSSRGSINFPLMPDWLDRPRQRADFENGKESVTDYDFISSGNSRSRIKLYPRTGRTHQLRVHAASEYGLGMPIVGDRLYGMNTGGMQRLHLHSQKIEFTFPIDGKSYIFEVAEPF